MGAFGHQHNTVIAQFMGFFQKGINVQPFLTTPKPGVTHRVQAGFYFKISRVACRGLNGLKRSGRSQK